MSSDVFHALLSDLMSDVENEALRLSKVFEREAADLASEDPIAQLVASSAIGSMVSKIYTKSEDIFRKIAQKIDQDVPGGDSWHLDLLRQMKTVSRDRPAFLMNDTFAAFDHLRRFRHFERNSYASDISPELIPEKVQVTLNAVELLRRDFSAFSAVYF